MAALAAFFSPVVFAATDNSQLSWTAPTTNEDGTPLTDLAGYGLYVKVPGDADFTRVTNPDSTPLLIAPDQTSYAAQVTYPDGASGNIEFYLTALDFSGNESVPSNIELKPVDDQTPGAPTLTITISLKFDNFGQISVAQSTIE